MTTPARLLRFDGKTSDRTEIVSANDLWYSPRDLDINLPMGEVVVLDHEGGVVFLMLPTLRTFYGVMGDASVIADGSDLWVGALAVAIVPEPGTVALCWIAGVFIVMTGRRTKTR